MVNTPAIGNLIREKGNLFAITKQSQYGMNTLEQCLNDLYTNGLITKEEH